MPFRVTKAFQSTCLLITHKDMKAHLEEEQTQNCLKTFLNRLKAKNIPLDKWRHTD